MLSKKFIEIKDILEKAKEEGERFFIENKFVRNYNHLV